MVAVRKFGPAKLRSIQGPNDKQDIANLLSATTVIILANPGHTTALNGRKRLIFAGLHDPQRELDLLAPLAGIKDAAKQEALWHHRRWTIHYLYGSPCTDPTSLGSWDTRSSPQIRAPRAIWDTELSLASRACEVYPRNYHAWTHRLLCSRAFVHSCSQPSSSDLSPDPGAELTSFLRGDIDTVKQWIERHVSDFSAAHYLLQLLRTVSHIGESQSPTMNHAPSNEPPEDRGAVMVHAMSLVRDYPTHEALWMYLRGSTDLYVVDERLRKEKDTCIELTQLDAMVDDLACSHNDRTVRTYALRLQAWRNVSLLDEIYKSTLTSMLSGYFCRRSCPPPTIWSRRLKSCRFLGQC